MAETPTPEQVAQGQARAGGTTSTSDKLVTKISTQAKSSAGGPPTNKGSKKTGLVGRPVGSDIIIRQDVVSAPPQTAGGQPSTATVPITAKVRYAAGDGQTYFATLPLQQRVDILARLSQIPGLYGKNQAYTPQALLNYAKAGTVPIRKEDATALEKVMYYADTTGKSVTASVNDLLSNPTIAMQYFDMPGVVGGGKKISTTPAPALAAELDESFRDYLDIPADSKIAKEYADSVIAAEKKRGGSITALERKNILLDFVQNKAKDMFQQSVASGDSKLLEQGALGQTFQQIRNAYDKYGIPISDKQLSKLAMNGVRSNQALQNVMGKIQLQAEAAFPALKEYLKQGLNTRDALATHIGMYSQVYGIPENQVKISDMYDAFAGDKLTTPSEWKKVLYSKPEFKNTDMYQRQLSSDANALLRNFIG